MGITSVTNPGSGSNNQVSPDADVTFAWVCSPQYAYEFMYKGSQDNGMWISTGKVVSSAQSFTIPAASVRPNEYYEWAVKVWVDIDSNSETWNGVFLTTAQRNAKAHMKNANAPGQLIRIVDIGASNLDSKARVQTPTGVGELDIVPTNHVAASKVRIAQIADDVKAVAKHLAGYTPSYTHSNSGTDRYDNHVDTGQDNDHVDTYADSEDGTYSEGYSQNVYLENYPDRYSAYTDTGFAGPGFYTDAGYSVYQVYLEGYSNSYDKHTDTGYEVYNERINTGYDIYSDFVNTYHDSYDEHSDVGYNAYDDHLDSYANSYNKHTDDGYDAYGNFIDSGYDAYSNFTDTGYDRYSNHTDYSDYSDYGNSYQNSYSDGSIKCFEEHTIVYLWHGEDIMLKDVRKGDFILGINEAGQLVSNEVLLAEIAPSTKYVLINNEYKVNVFGDHVFLTLDEDGCYKETPLSELTIGTKIVTDNKPYEVTSLELVHERFNKVKLVLGGNETYIAGKACIVSKGASHKFLKGAKE
jgi:hypothetical protein